ncbi:hypothetical protein [Mycobacterium palustre]|uniref:hypothetical protein n=1 Tax=Mycobacterium palustre TaxID=153971 RepID=UPI00114DE813|nr:hypothetical protein [Mycobacterium palustre]
MNRKHATVIGSLAVTFALTLGFSVCAALPANAMNGSLQFCPYLPYLTRGEGQLLQDDYSWTLFNVDPAGRSVVAQSGRDRGCHAVSPAGNAAYKIAVQTDCTLGGAGNFRLTGTSAVIWVPEDATQVHARVNSNWSSC